MKLVREAIVVLSAVLMAWPSATATAQTKIAFPDPNFEAAVRSALAKPRGRLTSTDMESLTSLTVFHGGITNLSGLEWAINLTGLYLPGNSISDLSPLAGLSTLTDLNLGDNLITEGSALLGLTNLAGLWLYGNPIGSLTGLTNMNGLTSLTLYNNGLADIAPLARLTNLSYLELRWNPLTNAEPVLAGLTNLTTLHLGGTSISNVSFLQNLTRLNFLNLDHNGISDLSPLTVLPNLNGLDLSYNPLTNFDQLSAFTKLTSLYLSGTSISNVTALQSLTQLTTLMLYSNLVSDLSPLAGLTNLSDLGLSWNPTTNHEALAGLTNLVSLWLDGNSISNLSFVQGMVRLNALGLRYNRLGDLELLGGLTNLTAVHADYNQLTNIAALQSLPYLSWAGLVGNLLDLDNGSPATTLIQSLQSRGVNMPYLPQNQPPSLSVSANWTIATDAISSLGFYVSDDLTPSDKLLVTASSLNTNLITNANLLLAGTFYNRTLTVAPEPGQTGATEITLTVTDDAGLSTNVTVLVTVVVPQPVDVPDPNLEEVIRSMLGKPTDSLTSLDLESLNYLSIYNGNITDLSGLEWATNLTSLYLGYNSINNLTELQTLSQLTYLNLENNMITDLSPLSGLTNLNSLYLQQNLLTNIVSVQNLPMLSYLDVSLNLLDLSPGASGTLVVESLQGRDVAVISLPQREPPAIEVRTNWVIAVNATSSSSFSVTANGSSSENLIVTADSSNTNLLPNANVVVGRDINLVSLDWILTLTPVVDQVGITTITLTAIDGVGLSTTTTVLVTVVGPQPLAGILFNNTNLTWTTSGSSPWFGQNRVTHDGDLAAQSGAIGDAEESPLETTVVGPGKLTFWWRVSSEENWDWLEFYVNGVLQTNRISGEVDWQEQIVSIPLGTQTLRWQYSKDSGCCGYGSDAGWLDQVTFVPLSWLEAATTPTNGQFQLILHPIPGKLYEILVSTNLTGWSSLAVVVSTNDTILYSDTVANSDARFYRLHELPASSIWLQNPDRVGDAIQLVLHSPAGLRFEIQTSTNFASWSALATITNTLGTVQYTDTLAIDSPVHFYRALLVP